ncbi:MAG TPA: response regulator, partial [Verrucomicrobiae bacterium]|nr:response regulator [Verrucomicrobiae bacterium]
VEGGKLPRGQGELIMVVDDEEAILEVTRRALERFGYRVVTAADGASAVALYAQRRDEIAVVLTDMMMPVMDGATAIFALQRINPGVKVIAASGLGSHDSLTRIGDSGVKHFLPKPYSAEALLKALRELIAPGRE